MKRIAFAFALIPAFVGLSLTVGNAVAQPKTLKEQLVGTWKMVSQADNSLGPNPKGVYMFDANGNFTQILTRSDLPKMPSRSKATPEQAKAVVAGSIASYGTYTVNEAEKLINVHFESSTFSSYNGTEGKRMIKFQTADEVTITNPRSSEGTVAESIWRRAK